MPLSISHSCSADLNLGSKETELTPQIFLSFIVMLLKPTLITFCGLAEQIILLKEAAVLKEYSCQEGVCVVCNSV